MDRYVSKIGTKNQSLFLFQDIFQNVISYHFYFILLSIQIYFFPPCNKISCRLSTRPECKQTRDSLYKGRDKSFPRNDASRRLRRTMFLRGFQLP